jgi:MSHA pilin protein MshD
MMTGRQRGFTLIELIIFIVVVGVGVAGILSVYTTSIKNSADPLVRKQALAIAESLLEEILLKDATDPNGGPNGRSACASGGAASTRPTWNDVCDYNGYTAAAGVDLVGAGASLPGYSISPPVLVVQLAKDSSDLTGVAALKVTVSVSSPQSTISLTGYRVCYFETDPSTGASRCP